MNSLKLSLNHLIIFIFFVLALFLLLMAGRVGFQAWQTAGSLDENLAISTSPTLNRQSIEKAAKWLRQSTTTSVEDTKEKTVSTPVPTPTSVPSALKIEIINASGIDGAASELSQALEVNAQFDLKTNQVVLDESSLVYKNRYKDQVTAWQEKLNALGWSELAMQEQSDDNEFDVIITLGAK